MDNCSSFALFFPQNNPRVTGCNMLHKCLLEDPCFLKWVKSALHTCFVLAGAISAHNGQVCSSWGNYHFKTFDGDVFYFPGTCNYLFASDCKRNYEDFNIQIRRSVVNNLPTISHITVKLNGFYIEMTSGSVIFNSKM